jgi:PAS domain-containing protein
LASKVLHEILVVSARLEAERKAFEEAQSRLTAILDTTSDLVGISNVEGEQLYLNSAGYRMLGLPDDLGYYGSLLWANIIPTGLKSMVLNEGIPAAIREGSLARGDRPADLGIRGENSPSLR